MIRAVFLRGAIIATAGVAAAAIGLLAPLAAGHAIEAASPVVIEREAWNVLAGFGLLLACIFGGAAILAVSMEKTNDAPAP